MHPWTGHRTAGGEPLAWDEDDLPLAFVLNDQGSADLPDDSDGLALRKAFGAWGTLEGSSLGFIEDADPASTARTDWPADDIHLALFDEDGSSGFFPPGSGLVAVTAFEFQVVSGRMLDADILFNGFEHAFATDLDPQAFDLRSLAVHEVGHLAGLAHSALGAAAMAPFVQEGAFTGRTLHDDDVAGAETLYPLLVRGEIRGSVTRNGLPVTGAHVWCTLGNGHAASSTLSEADGGFALTGLLPGDYRVVAAPLDAPFDAGDIGALGLDAPDTSFRQGTLFGVSIAGAEVEDVGELAVSDDSALAILGPVVPAVLRRDTTTEVQLAVAGVVGGTPEVSIPSNASLVVSNVEFDGGSALSFDVEVPPGAQLGAFEVLIETALGTTASWPGFLEVVPVAPTLTFVTPNCGGSDGSLETFAAGTGLADTIEFVFGDREASITAVSVGGNAVAGFPPTGLLGPVDVVAINSSGDEARLPAAFSVVPGGVPVVSTVFPKAGTRVGGTLVTITGSGFGSGSVVVFDATPAVQTNLISANVLTAVTPALTAGVYSVSVVQLGCETALLGTQLAAYTSVVGDDPTVTDVQPRILMQSGGELITVTGTGFVAGAQVQMFNDPLTGLGGVPLVTDFVGTTTLTATTPAGPLPGGPATVYVGLPNGQEALLADAVEVNAPTIEDVAPAVIAQSGGVTLTVTGTGYVDGAVVELFTEFPSFTGGTPLETTFLSDTQLTAVVPTSLAPLPAGLANLAVIMPGPLLAGAVDAVEIVPPTLALVTPDQLGAGGGELITLTGFGFTPEAQVRLFVDGGDFSGGTALATTFVSGTSLTATTPAGPLPGGLASLAVDLPGGLVAGLTDGVEVLFPGLVGVEPALLAHSGGEEFSVSGIHFTADAVVELFTDALTLTGGTVLATTFVNDEELLAVSPAGPLPLGPANLAVRMPGGVVVLLEDAVEIAPLLGHASTASGSLGDDDPMDPMLFESLGGATVTVIHKRVGKTDLIPKLVLLDPDGAPLLSSDPADPSFDPERVVASDKQVTLKGVVLPATGRYQLQARRMSGQGAFKLAFKEKLPGSALDVLVKKKDGVVVGPGDTHELQVEAKAGTLVTGVFKGDKKADLGLVLVGLWASATPSPETLLLFTDETGQKGGEPGLVPLLSVSPDLATLRVKSVPLPVLGTYRMEIGAATDAAGALTAGLHFRPPVSKAKFTDL